MIGCNVSNRRLAAWSKLTGVPRGDLEGERRYVALAASPHCATWHHARPTAPAFSRESAKGIHALDRGPFAGH